MSMWAIVSLVLFVLYWRERQQREELADQTRELSKRVKHLEKAAHPGDSRIEGSADAIRELGDLRARVRVLERIATDQNSSEARNADAIAAEIESLRGAMTGRVASKEEQSE
ncbi:hypothetical protein [Erythrobacter sp. R86502]|uniref:hypothetical protein n=1 Tax=Erythrobacter sp. R86502 TaxID=3093846 RepID=UPI0036D23E28